MSYSNRSRLRAKNRNTFKDVEKAHINSAELHEWSEEAIQNAYGYLTQAQLKLKAEFTQLEDAKVMLLGELTRRQPTKSTHV